MTLICAGLDLARHGGAWRQVRARVSLGAGGRRWGGVAARKGAMMDYPPCLKCQKGLMLPLSDYGRDGAAIRYKAWVCHNPDCGHTIRIDNGEISAGRLQV
jgi:hypothetical protein